MFHRNLKFCYFYTFENIIYKNKSVFKWFHMLFIWMGNVTPCRGNFTHDLWGGPEEEGDFERRLFWHECVLWRVNLLFWVINQLSQKVALFTFGKNVQINTKQWVKLPQLTVPFLFAKSYLLLRKNQSLGRAAALDSPRVMESRQEFGSESIFQISWFESIFELSLIHISEPTRPY